MAFYYRAASASHKGRTIAGHKNLCRKAYAPLKQAATSKVSVVISNTNCGDNHCRDLKWIPTKVEGLKLAVGINMTVRPIHIVEQKRSWGPYCPRSKS